MNEPPAARDDEAHVLRPRTRPFLDTPVTGDSDPHTGLRAPAVRPFVLTSGRVEGSHSDIRLETQVSARRWPGATSGAALTPELLAIVAVCAEPTSVAEISARLHLHLGVTRVLVGDLSAAGHVDIHLTDATSPHDPDTILRVIRGLRSIS